MTNKLTLSILSIAIAIKLIAIFNTSFDLFGDEAQYWIWSKNLDFGYYSKPPMISWVVALFTFLFGDSFEVIKLISFFLYFVISFLIFLISLELYNNKSLAFLSAASFYLIPIVSFSSFLLSTDVILIVFWSLSILYTLKIRADPKLINFILLGVFLGLAFLAKYAAVYFLLSMILIIIIDKKMKDIFLEKKYFFLIAFVLVILILLPNIMWNINNSWVTLSHTSDNAALNRFGFNLFQGFEFILAQGIMIGPLLFFFFFYSVKKTERNFQTLFLLIFSIPVIFIVLLESMLVRANANWAAVGLITLFIFFFNHVYNNSKKIIHLNNFLNFVFCFIFFILISINHSSKIFDRISGISSFASLLEKNNLQKIENLVIEDRLLYSNLRYIYRNSSKKMFMPYIPSNKIKNHFELSSPLKPGFKENFLFIGSPESIRYLSKDKKITKIDSYTATFTKQTIDIYEVNF